MSRAERLEHAAKLPALLWVLTAPLAEVEAPRAPEAFPGAAKDAAALDELEGLFPAARAALDRCGERRVRFLRCLVIELGLADEGVIRGPTADRVRRRAATYEALTWLQARGWR